MKAALLTFTLATLTLFTATAQTEHPDTLMSVPAAVTDKPDSLSRENSCNRAVMMPEIKEPAVRHPLTTDNLDTREISSMFHNFTPGIATVGAWSTGNINAVGGTSSFPGMMGVESGMVMFSQRVGRFTVEGDVGAVKYGYYRGLRTMWGFGGSLSYDISDRVGVTLFGRYYTKPKLYQPAMLGFSPSQTFGGFMSLKLDDHWGVDVGAQSIMQQNTRNYRFEPIVTPYYKFNNNVKIGVNVGGILYNIFRSSRQEFGNPTIAPPRSFGN